MGWDNRTENPQMLQYLASMGLKSKVHSAVDLLLIIILFDCNGSDDDVKFCCSVFSLKEKRS